MQETNQKNVKGQDIGRKIKQAIFDAPDDENGRWTQQRVADAIGITKDHLSRVVNGRGEISIDALSKIALLFDCYFVLDVDGAELIVNNGASKRY